MVAPLNVARLGGGGVSIPVSLDTATLKAQSSQVRQELAQFEKDSKLKPKVEWDFQELAAKREAKRVVMALERETAKIRVAIELDQKGLGAAAAKAGLLSASQMAAIGYGTRPIATEGYDDTGMVYGPFRAGQRRFGFVEQSARGEIASQLRAARAARRHAEVQHEVLRRTARDEYDDTGMEYGPANRPSRLSRIFEATSMFRLGVAGAAAHYGLQAMGAAGGMARGMFLSGSGDAISSAQGQLGTLEGLKSIPGFGSAVHAMDEFAGITRAITSRMNSALSMESRVVRMAQLSGDPFSSAFAEEAKATRDLKRTAESANAGFEWAKWINNPYIYGGASLAKKAADADLAGQGPESALRLDIASRQSLAMIRGMAATGYTAEMNGAFMPQAAGLAGLQAQLRSTDENAPPFLRDLLGPMRGITGGLLSIPGINVQKLASESVWRGNLASLRRQGSLGEFGHLTTIGAGELTAQFRGDSTPGGIFSRLRGLQADVLNTPDEMVMTQQGPVNMRHLARLGAVSTARGLGAEFDYQNGGQASRINAGLGQAPDQLVRPPAFEARAEARRMIAQFIRNNGGVEGRESSPLSGLKETNELIRQLILQVGKLKDNATGATPLIQTPPRGGARTNPNPRD